MDSPKRLTINEVIAFNLARARRRAGWTQEEAAERLSQAMGKRWSNATLGAAERSWETERVREFNGDELMAFSKVYGQPLAYWFLPPDGGEKTQTYRLGADGQEISNFDLLRTVLPLGASHEFVDLARLATRQHDMDWAPSRPTWYMPEEQDERDEVERQGLPADVMPSPSAVVDEAKRQKVLRLLDEIRRVLDPWQDPPF